MYASPYKQDLTEYTASLCVSVIASMTEERFLHVEMVGAPIVESQTEIKDFAEVRVIGKCDGCCWERQTGQVRKMMKVSEELRLAITRADGFNEAVL